MSLRFKSMSFGAALLVAACGGSTVQPVAPVVPTPTPQATPPPIIAPTPTPSPSAAPTPAPCTEGLCEAPVTSTAPPARLTVRLFTVENGTGKFWPNWDTSEPIPMDFFARVDVTGKDEFGAETNGSVEPEWHFSDEELVRVSSNHTHQRRLKVLEKGGRLDIWVTQQGVTSNVITLRLVH
ncbi:MAG TPA: hypothetical protein VFQ51_15315 [Vicinamibacteria bacterium]|nr:hypothetical protein [Vicinamibacteria bacterium]